MTPNNICYCNDNLVCEYCSTNGIKYYKNIMDDFIQDKIAEIEKEKAVPNEYGFKDGLNKAIEILNK